MKSIKTIEYIRQYGLEKLIDQFNIITHRHEDYPNLVLLKYNQTESPMGEEIVQECRSLILDEDNNWNIVSYPYNKFFNYGEGFAKDIDWDSAKIYEKLDGSFVCLYYYDKDWRVSTSGSPDASGDLQVIDISYNDYFWNVWNELEYKLPDNTNMCYMFELTTPLNIIVVKYDKSMLTLHGVRDLITLQEVLPEEIALQYGWKCVNRYSFNNIDEVIKASKELKPREHEGYVIVDKYFNRIKIKSPQYVAIHHLKSRLSTRKILELIVMNEGHEFLNYFPEYSDIYYELEKKFLDIIKEIEKLWQEVKIIKDRKELALKIKGKSYMGVLFNLRDEKIKSVREGLEKMNIKKLEDMIENRNKI